jgi:hypothetical protein
MDLGTELNLRMTFAPDNWPDMWLMNAYYAMIYMMDAIIVHVLLLLINCFDHQKIFVLPGIKWNLLVGVKEFVYCP